MSFVFNSCPSQFGLWNEREIREEKKEKQLETGKMDS